MSGAAAPMASGAYLVNLAEQHATARGYQFDAAGKGELSRIVEQAMETAHQAGIFTVEDILRDVAPNTIRLTDSIITFAEGVFLTLNSVRQGFLKICPLFPFC